MAADLISSGEAPPEAVGVGMFMERFVENLLVVASDGVVKAWLCERDSASASAVIESFMVYRDLAKMCYGCYDAVGCSRSASVCYCKQ